MADNTREAEFILRARDAGSKKVFQEVASAVRDVKVALEEQVKAAAKGEVSAGDLRTTLRNLTEAQRTLANDKSLIEYHARLGEQLDAAKVKANEAAQAQAEMAAKLAEAGKPTREQERNLSKLNTASENAQKKVGQLAASLASQEAKLHAAGIDTAHLAEAQANLAAVSEETAGIYRQLQDAVDLYDVRLREHRATLKAAKDLAAENAKVLAEQEAPALRAAAVAYNAFEAACRKGAAAMKEADARKEAADKEAEAQAIRSAAVAYDRFEAACRKGAAAMKEADARKAAADKEAEAEALRQAANAYNAFEAACRRGALAMREADEEAAAASAEAHAQAIRSAAFAYDQFEAACRRGAAAMKDMEALQRFQDTGAQAVMRASAPVPPPLPRPAAPVSKTADNVRAIIDPAATATTTLAGLEAQIAKLDSQLGEGDGSLNGYREALTGLSAAQRAIVEQATLVDDYRNQEAAVRRAAEALRDARADVLTYGQAVAGATEPNEELSQALRRAEGQAATATAEFRRQEGQLVSLHERLGQAGIGVAELTSAEGRLEAASKATTAALARVQSAQSGKNNPVGSFLGLRPYELQNLSYQINDVFTQLGSGASITQTLAQQGGQIAQLFPKAIGAIISKAPQIAVVAVVLGSVAMAFKRITDLAGTEREFTAALALNTDAAEYNAHALAETARRLDDYGASAKDAKGEVKEFIAKGIDETQFERFGIAAQNMADVLGIKVPDAAKQLAEAFSGGYDEIKKLDDATNFLSVTEREHISTLFDEGKASEARTEAFRIFEEHAQDAADKSRGPWADAVHNLGEAWHNFLDWLGNTAPIKGAIWLMDKLAEAAKNASENMPGVDGKGAKFQDDFDAGVRTILGEARGNDRRGMQAVGSVILNRAEQTGQTVSQVVTSPKQFESMNNPKDRARVMSIDPSSPQYKAAAEVFEQLINGILKRDRFDSFYSPSGQQARAGDGRQLVPNWTRGQAGTDIGGNRYFSGVYKGSQAGPGVAVNPEMTRLEQSRRQLLTDRDLADARENGSMPSTLAARQELSKQVPSVAEIDKQIAAVDKRINEIRRKASDTVNEEASSRRKVGAEVLKQIEDEISLKEKSNDQDKIKIAGQKAYDRVLKGENGVHGDEKSADQARADAEHAESQRLALEHQKEAARVAREQAAAQAKDDAEFQRHLHEVTSTENELRNNLRGLQTGADNSRTTDLAARLDAIDQQYDRYAQSLAKAKALGMKGLPGATEAQDMTIEQATALAQQARDQLKNQATLKFYADSLADTEKTRADRLKEIADNEEADRITKVEAYDQAKAANELLDKQMADIAQRALDFAKALRTAKPDPALEAFIAKMQGAVNRATLPDSPKSSTAKFGNAELSGAETQLNAIISRRNELVGNYNKLVELGKITQEEARASTKQAYDEAQAEMQPVLDTMTALLQRMKDAGEITPAVFDAMSAHLAVVSSEAEYTDANFLKMKETMENSLTSSIVDGFNNIAESIGNLIAGSGDLGDVWTSLWQSGVRLVANFAKAVADLLIQMLALQAIKSIPGISGMAKGLTGGPDMAKTLAASALLSAAGKKVSAGGDKLLLSSVAWVAVAKQIDQAADKLLAAAAANAAAKLVHGGGIVGRPGGQRRGSISPLAFIGAPRMHSGGIVGLKPDEQATILQNGEEVLDKNSPRNALNGGLANKGGSQRPVSLRQVLVMKESDVAGAMQGAAGEDVTLTHIRNNIVTIRQQLNE